MAIPKDIERAHILRALAEIDQEGYPKGQKSTGYDIIHKGRSYPPKYVICLAYAYVKGYLYTHDKFSGGAHETNRFLANLGINVEKKSKQSELTYTEKADPATSNNPSATIHLQPKIIPGRMIADGTEEMETRYRKGIWKLVYPHLAAVELVPYAFTQQRIGMTEEVYRFFRTGKTIPYQEGSLLDEETSVPLSITFIYKDITYHAKIEVLVDQKYPHWFRAELSWDEDFAQLLEALFPDYHQSLGQKKPFSEDTPLIDKHMKSNPKLLLERKTNEPTNNVYLIQLQHPIDEKIFAQDIDAEDTENGWFHPRSDHDVNSASDTKAANVPNTGHALTPTQDTVSNNGAYPNNDQQHPLKDGAPKYYYGKRYERRPENRQRAIEIHGLICKACGFDFEAVYGERGKNFIEVHHIKPLSTLDGGEMEIVPETDLVPVCSNCHRMIHRYKDEVLTVEQVKSMIEKQRGRKP
ncbi:HNH endonuclease [Brevibacillus dissolubilis]|uniref:HNH endonuclease n=1 Tax=Brevibacillus dissolubilis TaxID=1844116 RepID=UPI0021000E6B|nr:HNH endonuclease [Brevibacillus dissolubilis]